MHSGQTLESLADFAGFSESTARKALGTLESLYLVTRDDGRYVTNITTLRRGDHVAGSVILRQALLGLRPFELLCEGLAAGESEAEAVRKSAALLGIKQDQVASFKVLISLGLGLGTLRREGGRLLLSRDIAPSATIASAVVKPEDVDSEAKVRLFNARWLGRPVNNALDETDRQLLAEALMKHSSDPRQSVDSSGQALEDFLRELASRKGHAAEARSANGAGQLATLLVSKGVIHSQHLKLVEAVGTVRNATAHRKDKKTLAPWGITPNGALAVFTMTLTALRSIGEFITTGRQTI